MSFNHVNGTVTCGAWFHSSALSTALFWLIISTAWYSRVKISLLFPGRSCQLQYDLCGATCFLDIDLRDMKSQDYLLIWKFSKTGCPWLELRDSTSLVFDLAIKGNWTLQGKITTWSIYSLRGRRLSFLYWNFPKTSYYKGISSFP